jgi:hypothetical protein
MQLFFYLEFLFHHLLISVLAFPRSSGLGNWILWFFLKLHIAIHINQAQTVQATQGVARWSPSLKYSRVRASIEKCVNTFLQLRWGIDLLQPWLIMGWGSTTTTSSCHHSTPT